METYDYIIIGAGPAGTVLASRLSRSPLKTSILLIEAGPDTAKISLATTIATPSNVAQLRGTEVDWNYEGAPQKHLNGKKIYVGGGKGLGGGTIINVGIWARGDSKDYDEWARLVGDDRWSWAGFLPYFRKTETYHDSTDTSGNHGFDGPVNVTSVSSSPGRKYPLREPLKKAWASMGVKEVADINCGAPLGLAEFAESRVDGKRVNAAATYALDKVAVMSDTLVTKVLINSKKNGTSEATGVELADGRKIFVKREVVISAGSIRTPQLLMLSGIGPREELARFGISQLVDSPDVGRNLWDHACMLQLWKARNPKEGIAIGPSWTDPAMLNSNPQDWSANISVPDEELRAALSKDGNQASKEENALLGSSRCHLGFIVVYNSFAHLPKDGSLVRTITLNLLPTSRGTVTLSSVDPMAKPVIDHNFYATEADRYKIRTGARTTAKLMNSPPVKELILGELVDEGQKPLTETSTDEEIDARFSQAAACLWHPAGTAAMGKVVDTKLRVNGVKGLRVVDASVLPIPISCPIQACVYALGEQAADIILSDLESASSQ